jgi:hypothetical protein
MLGFGRPSARPQPNLQTALSLADLATSGVTADEHRMIFFTDSYAEMTTWGWSVLQRIQPKPAVAVRGTGNSTAKNFGSGPWLR